MKKKSKDKMIDVLPMKTVTEKTGWWIFAKEYSRKKPDGWEDLGRAESSTVIRDGVVLDRVLVHSFCQTNLHIGRDKSGIFRFCPRCMGKTS